MAAALRQQEEMHISGHAKPLPSPGSANTFNTRPHLPTPPKMATYTPPPAGLGRGVIERTVALMGSAYRLPGRIYTPGICIAHLLRCTKRLYYDDRKRMRMRRNVIVYGPRGTCKSTISKFLLFEVFGGYDVSSPPVGLLARTRPAIAFMGVSWERDRGSMDPNGNIIPPVLQNADWIFASELMSSLGHTGDKRATKIEQLNQVFEEGTQSVSLVKAFNMDLEEREKMAKALPTGCGYTYDPVGCYLRYDARCTFIGCSRFLPDKLLNELESSGYWSRHSIEELRMTDAQAKDYADKKFGPDPSTNELELVRGKWLDMWNTEFGSVNAPPDEYIDRCVRWFNEQLEQVGVETERAFADLFSSRDDTDIAQLLTASALERISASRALGDRSRIEQLDYTEADVAATQRWLVGRLSHLRNAFDQGKSEKEAIEGDETSVLLTSYLRHMHESKEEYDHFESRDLVDFCITKKKMGERTARRHLRQMKKDRLVRSHPGKPGYYYVDDRAIERAGLIVPHEDHEPAASDDDDGEEPHEEQDHHDRDDN